MLNRSIGAFLIAFVAFTVVCSAVQLPERRTTCNTYVVSGISGGFTQRLLANFSNVTPGTNIASLLSQYGMSISQYTVDDTPIPHEFTPSNVAAGSGSLNLKVSAHNSNSATPIESAEVLTNDVFKYASVRTVLKSSKIPGVVEGNFFYLNDNQEIDLEILTTTISHSSSCVPAGIWATNQALVPGNSPTDQVIPFNFDPTQDFHEYRIDWSSTSTTFYIDGQQKARFTSNVPTQAGHWIWNAWSNGDPCWSNGPPTSDSITQIRSIDIYKGYTTTVTGSVCHV